ncbi:MAG: hypothetical protein HON48_22315 [Desulfobacula sp.]|jgi:hypothetical protein|nr:hypothetical protein [Desulfobacula sp.]
MNLAKTLLMAAGSNGRLAHIITGSGDVQHSTDQQKIGATSIKFDGNDTLTVLASDDLDRQIITVEWFAYYASINDGTWFGVADTAAYGYIQTYSSVVKTYPGNSNKGNFGTPSNATWHHYAVVCDGTNLKTYLDGTNITSTAFTGIMFDTSEGNLTIGTGYYQGLIGYVDEIRISSSIRYPTSFTPTTTHFTDDSDTLLLIQSDTTDGSTVFTDG